MSDADEDGVGSIELTALTRNFFLETYDTQDPAFYEALTLASDELILQYETGGFMPTFYQAFVTAKDMMTLEKQAHTPVPAPVPPVPVPVPAAPALPVPAPEDANGVDVDGLTPRSRRRLLLASAAEKRLSSV